jgi:hypothetical protein
MYIQNNTLSFLAGTNVYYASANVGEISGNTISDGFGIHSNGMSVYGGGSSEPPTASDVNIFNNRILGSKLSDNPTGGGSFTVEKCDRLNFYNNVFDGRFSHWGVSTTGKSWLRFDNNTITESLGLYVSPISAYANYYIQNNTLGGLFIGSTSPVTNWGTITNVIKSGNIYKSYTNQQSGPYGWILGPGELYNVGEGIKIPLSPSTLIVN